MLQKLVIKNVALIDSVEIDFTKGLNVLSGETGAGKSVIIDKQKNNGDICIITTYL